MTRRDTLLALQERVREATGPNYALECDIARMVDAELTQAVAHLRATPPNYTASIDAALALVERVLPGWRYDLDNLPGEDGADFVTWLQPEDMNLKGVCRPGATMPLAILNALLSALLAQEPAPQEPGRG